MKFLVIPLMFIAISCGKIESTSGHGGIGELRSYSPAAVSSGDFNIFQQICQGLTIKTQKLGSTLPTVSYDVVQKDCDGKEFNSETQTVTVVKLDQSYQYIVRATNFPFVFPKVETPNDGVFASVCGKTDLKMPVLLANGDAQWVKAGGACPSATGANCVTVETASKDPVSQLYRVHTREYIGFNVQLNNGKYGFFTFRRKLAESACSAPKFTEDIVNFL